MIESLSQICVRTLEKNVTKLEKIGDAKIWLTKAEDVYQVTADAIKKNPHILCKIIPPSKENEFLIKNYSETFKKSKTITTNIEGNENK